MLPQFRKPEAEAPKAPVTPAPALPQATSPLGTQAPASSSVRPASFRAAASGATSVIGPDLVIQGNLISKGEVQIEGEIQGDIHGTNIVVGEKAKVTGGIIAEECIIRGHVLGTVRSRRVLLQATSHVEGDIYHQTVAIEQGAFFEGKSRRTEDPLAGTQAQRGTPPSLTPAPLASASPVPMTPPSPAASS